MNTHITARPILLTRHGESQDNVRGRIGGDPPLRYFDVPLIKDFRWSQKLGESSLIFW